ncbi:MAG: 4-hydroxybenzoate octaprenyltransferase [Dehalococcoidia bacterium]|nr:4-hydroxybenzoate octaprenyltransferase [Dehalococcoidia bacterium]
MLQPGCPNVKRNANAPDGITAMKTQQLGQRSSTAQPSAAVAALGKARAYLETVRPEHTVFALPLAYMALFLAEEGAPRAHVWVWITVAFIGARFAGMAANRLADASLDAHIPRNAGRAIPSGRLGRHEAAIFIAAALGLLAGASFQLGHWPKLLWPAVVLALLVSPYAKRYTWASSFSIGMVYLLIPSGVWVAATGEFGWAPLLLGLASAMWNTGFDAIYRCQDREVDQRLGLHSLAADFGVGPALLAARLLHAGVLVCLLALGVVLDVGPWYYAGLGVTALLFAYEHSLISPRDLSRLNRAFFTMNGIIGITLFLFVAIDTLVR